MPLSDREQQMLEQIERSLLAEDPQFASQVRAAEPRRYLRRRLITAALMFLVGVAILLAGVISTLRYSGIPIVSVFGFLVMFTASVFAAEAYRRAHPNEQAQMRGSGSSPGGGKSSFLSRLEQRWHRRSQ